MFGADNLVRAAIVEALLGWYGMCAGCHGEGGGGQLVALPWPENLDTGLDSAN